VIFLEVFQMARVYNFSAGPSMLPEEVLKKAAAEMLDYEGSGQSVMEMSHRSKVYDSIIKGAEKLLRELMNIPDNYKVLFLQGGASTQFAAIPLNFMNKSGKADFVITGQWAKKAYQEAQKYGECKAVASSADKTFSYIPKLDKNEFTKDADYFYICMNNTIYGTVYHELPDTGDVPLIADISSCFLSEPIDVTKFAMVYGGAQKNVAPAGLTICIIREDMLGNARDAEEDSTEECTDRTLCRVCRRDEPFTLCQESRGRRYLEPPEHTQCPHRRDGQTGCRALQETVRTA
jgi:phosphoserine aminotransferase